MKVKYYLARLFFLMLLSAGVILFSGCDLQEPELTEAGPEMTSAVRVAESVDQRSSTANEATGDPHVLALMRKFNDQLAETGLNIAVETIEVFTIGKGRPSNRIHQVPRRWVAGDPRRSAQGNDLTYLVDLSRGATANGLTPSQTENAIDRALSTWNSSKAAKKIEIVKRNDPGTDVTLYDASFPEIGGEAGYPFAADIVNAGWWPGSLFDMVWPPDGSDTILGFSIGFIFVDSEGNPTDINGDNYLDTALNEIYYNNNLGNPDGTRPDYPWAIDEELPSIDVETVALHENGHALELGHFGSPPDAVMNPAYAGIRHALFSPDEAGVNIVWQSWPQ